MQPAAAATAARLPKGRNPLPFAALPHALADDERLKPIDVLLARAILKFARGDDHAWPSVGSLMEAVRRSRRVVQQGLRRLEAAGWVLVEPASNPTGRVLVLVWRRPPGAVASAPGAPGFAPRPAPPVAPDRNVNKPRFKDQEAGRADSRPRPQAVAPVATPGPAKGEPIVADGEFAQAVAPVATPGPAPSPTPRPVPTEAPMPIAAALPSTPTRRPATPANDLARLAEATDDPILRAEAARRLAPMAPAPAAPVSTRDLLERIGESPAFVPRAAALLCAEFADPASWPGFHDRCLKAFRRQIPVAALVDAYDLAIAPGARNPGAVFMSRLRVGG